MNFVRALQTPQYRNGILGGRLGDEHALKPSRQRRVLLDMTIFVQRRRAHELQFSPRQRRLEHVGHIHRSFSLAGADDGMKLVDEQDDLALAHLDVLQYRPETFLELSAIHGPRYEPGEIEGDDALVLHGFGNLSGHDALRQTLGDRRLAHARFSDQYRIILRASRQYLQSSSYLVVSTDHRIQLIPLTGHRR